MCDAASRALEIWEEHIGIESSPGAFHQVDQTQISAFADTTLDRQYIHVDPKRAEAESPYRTTIAHGFLTLSLVPHLVKSIPESNPHALAEQVMTINYGLDRVRFPAAVKVDSRIRARRTLLAAELKDNNAIQLKYLVTVEIEGEEKPACVAECLTRVVYE